jgi:hypothetical protein
MSAESNFVRQQGFTDAPAESCGARYPALMWQPRVVGVLVLIGLVLQEGAYFLALSAILWWNALIPALNPFDAIYNAIVAGSRDGTRLTPAPGPRRFAQGMAGTFLLAIGLALLAGMRPLAWALEALIVCALGALILGKFCLGSYVYWMLRGRVDFANRTLPWSRVE